MYILASMASVPRLNLTHGQVAWAICAGQPPDKVTVDRLRYLRQLNIPFSEDEVGVGRGNRLSFGFDHLIECAIAIWSMRRGTKPAEPIVAAVLNRNDEPIAEPRLRDTSREVAIQATLAATAVRVNLKLDLMLRMMPRHP